MTEEKDKLSYEEYIEICERVDIPVSDRLTLEEWNEPTNCSPDHLMRGIGKPGFRPFGDIGNLGASALAGKLAGEAMNILLDEINKSVNMDELPGKAKEFVRTRFKGKDRDTPSDGGDDGGGKARPTPGGMSGGGDMVSRQLSLNPRPYAININSGIPHNTSAKVRLDADLFSCPLHISTCKLQFPTVASDPRFQSWWDINVTNKFQTLAQRRVGFNVNAPVVFSSSRLRNFYTIMTQALMCYYSYMKPLIYSPVNRNDGVTFWRSKLTPGDIDLLAQLRDALNVLPIPPFLNAWLFQCYGVYYRQSMNPGSPLWGLHSESLGTASGTVFEGTDDSSISTNLGNLADPSFRDTANMIARVFPSWQDTEKLFVTPTVAEFSPNMNTLWANIPFVGGLGYPRVANEQTPIIYNTYADSLDGLVLACTGAFDTTNTRWIPSMMVPVANNCNNGTTPVSRLSYSNLSGTAGMQWSGEFTRLSYSRGETYTNVGSTCHPFDKFGTERAMFVTPASVREVAYMAVDKLVGLDAENIARYEKTTSATDADEKMSKPRRRKRRK